MVTNEREEIVGLAWALADAWSAIEHTLNGSLGAVRGVTYSEYRLLSAIEAGPKNGSSRADLGRAVGLSPSAITRALRPLEKLGIVRTTKHERDARLAIAQLTPDGKELVSDATGVVGDVMTQVAERTTLTPNKRRDLLAALHELARI